MIDASEYTPEPEDEGRAAVLRVIAEAPIGRDWDSESPGAILDALAADGYRVVKVIGGSTVRHGDHLVGFMWGWDVRLPDWRHGDG